MLVCTGLPDRQARGAGLDQRPPHRAVRATTAAATFPTPATSSSVVRAVDARSQPDHGHGKPAAAAQPGVDPQQDVGQLGPREPGRIGDGQRPGGRRGGRAVTEAVGEDGEDAGIVDEPGPASPLTRSPRQGVRGRPPRGVAGCADPGTDDRALAGLAQPATVVATRVTAPGPTPRDRSAVL